MNLLPQRPFAGPRFLALTDCSRRREEADRLPSALHPPPHVGGYGVCEKTGLERRTPSDHRGVALVITLILLAVITTLAIAFLGITHRETGAVDSMARTTDAEMATDSALERAKAEIAAVYPGQNLNAAVTNTLGPDMMVSICCQNYDATPAVRRTIPYDRLNPDQRITNRYDAAPPVFVQTNVVVDAQHPLDDRFFVDLNRNGIFEESGYVPNTINNPAGPGRFQLEVQAGNIVTNWRIGDPQWVGLLQNPRQAHGPNNRHIARYAFMVQPVGRSLDVNWIHNEGVSRAAARPGFYREQGVGSWELNLAGFLADLNTNQWGKFAAAPYAYLSDPSPTGEGGKGDAFADAGELLGYRYGAGGRGNLNRADQLFLGAGSLFTTDQIDLFANGFGTTASPNPDDNDQPNQPWPGADSANHFFSLHDYFGKLINPTGFTNRLRQASSRGNSYDRYTFYRMLAQLGTDSVEEKEEDGKINLNFVNIRSWVPSSSFRYRAEDLVSWTNSTAPFIAQMGRPGPELFFLTVVTNLLVHEPDLAFMVTNNPVGGSVFAIPIFNITNRSMDSTNLPLNGPMYSARLHQILQLAANIYDATTGSKRGEEFPYFPSIFRPFFSERNGNVYITDYTLISEIESADSFRSNLLYRWRDLESGDTLSSQDGSKDLVYGIPLILGARKGFPSFSEVGVVSVAQATRKLTMYRSTPGKEWDKLEQQYSLQARTMVQVEARNPYDYSYPRPLEFLTGLKVGLEVKERTNAVPFARTDWVTGYSTNIPALRWVGEPIRLDQAKGTNHLRASHLFATNLLNLLVITNADGKMPTNQWTVNLTNRLLFILVDRSEPLRFPGGRIIDFVTLNRPHNKFEIGAKMEEELTDAPGQIRRMWSSADGGKYSVGIGTQIEVSANPSLLGPAESTGEYAWGNYDTLTAPSRDAAAVHWSTFFGDKSILETNQAPFSPSRIVVQANFFQVDDPQVHYTFEDLRDEPAYKIYKTEPLRSARTNLSVSIGQRNFHSLSWNKGDFVAAPASGETPGQGTLDPTVRDPGVIHASYWNFPTNHFPSIGWLGRVHRGTPWQTIYLKSRLPNQNWVEHTGNQRTFHPYGANLMQPQRDWELMDIFTTAPHPNATRGRLSINQTNLAAWSAVLSGVLARTPDDPDGAGYVLFSDQAMEPNAITPEVQNVVTAINRNRDRYNSNQFNSFGQYSRFGQLLSTPELTDASPILNAKPSVFNAATPDGLAVVSDEDYERIPQQILSLLKVGEPRFVIYGWGQSLKPARLGVQYDGSGRIDPTKPLSGPSIDPGTKTVNNYQVTGEVATRSVVRVVFPERYSTNNLPDYRRPRLVVESFNVIPVE